MIISIDDNYYLICTYILSGIIGLCIGSFLNVVIYRVPLNMSLARPQSHCPKCGNNIKWYDNIPVVSYLILKGKCRNCKEPISIRYTLVEILTSILFILSSILFHTNCIYMIISMIMCSILICITFIDLEHMIIPDRFQVVLLVLGVLSIFIDNTISWKSHLIGFTVSFICFLLIYLVGKKIMHKEVLGGGDVKLISVVSLILGWEKLILMMLISTITCLVFIVVNIIKGKKLGEFPFGPYISLGALISLFFGQWIIAWYIGLLI